MSTDNGLRKANGQYVYFQFARLLQIDFNKMKVSFLFILYMVDVVNFVQNHKNLTENNQEIWYNEIGISQTNNHICRYKTPNRKPDIVPKTKENQGE